MSENPKIQKEDLIKAGVIPAKTPDQQVSIFLLACETTGLNPYLKEIYLVRKPSRRYTDKFGKVVDVPEQYFTMISYHTFRRIAHESGAYLGSTGIMYDWKPNGEYRSMAEVIASGKDPMTATMVVYKNVGGIKAEFPFTVAFREFISKTENSSHTHNTMTLHMIGKVCEAHALRMAFPLLAKYHIPEELPAIEGTTIAAEEAKPMSLAEGAKQNDLEQSIQRFVDGIQDATAEEAAALFRTLPDAAKKSPMAVDALQSRTVAYWCGELDRMEFASQKELDDWCSGISPKVAGLLQTSEQWQALYLAKIAVPSSELFNGR